MTPENRSLLERWTKTGAPISPAIAAALAEIDTLTARVKELEGRLAASERNRLERFLRGEP